MIYHPERLQGIHPNLVLILEAVSDGGWDLDMLEGVRTKERQQELFDQGASKTLDSKHLIQPDGYGHAMDYAKHPVNWKDTNGFYFLGGYILGLAHQMAIGIRFGGDWDSDKDLHDQTFNDLDHIELLEVA